MEEFTPEHRQKLQSLFHAAVDLPDNERAAYLATACAGEPALLAEVERLIAAFQKAGGFMESYAIHAAARQAVTTQPATAIGQFLNHYQILELLGRGGMGEVYRAKDSRLGREVAVKVLPSSFAHDEGLLRRFQQEARAASALNHQNILIVHDLGEANSTPFIATELIRGVTLRERMDQAPISIREALRIAIQVADALAAAHKARIIHRDIKPANIMLRNDGIAKVLDFGLAKFTERLIKQEINPSVSPNADLSLVHTEQGTIMGTYKYASPEQLQAQDTDERTDVWSLGIVLYEMIVGNAPFNGLTLEEVRKAVLTREPRPIEGFSLEVSDEVQHIITRALSKGRAQRYQTIEDMLLDLKILEERIEFEDRIGLEKGNQGLFIGEKYAQYLVEWRVSAQAGFPVFNWAAFLLPIPWLAYRRMYLYLGVLLMAVFALGLLIERAGMEMRYVVPTLGLSLGLGLGILGNSLYRLHVTRKLRGIKQRNLGCSQEMALIKRTGGTSKLMGILSLLLVLAAVFLLPEFFAYARHQRGVADREQLARATAREANALFGRASGFLLQAEDLASQIAAIPDPEKEAALIKEHALNQVRLLTQATLMMREASSKFDQADLLLNDEELKKQYNLMKQAVLKYAEVSDLARQQAEVLLKIDEQPLSETFAQYEQIGNRARPIAQEALALLIEGRKLLDEYSTKTEDLQAGSPATPLP